MKNQKRAVDNTTNEEDSVYVIGEYCMMDTLNILTYECYAKVYRRLHRAGIKRRPYFEEYFEECKRLELLSDLCEDGWRKGYEIVADLFDDNEASGNACDEEAVFAMNVKEVLDLFNKRR